jgi:hypothetical protein
MIQHTSSLFALFLNDLQSFLEKENLPGLKTISEKNEENLNIYLKDSGNIDCTS